MYSYNPLYIFPIIFSDDTAPYIYVNRVNNSESNILSTHKIMIYPPSWVNNNVIKSIEQYPLLPFPITCTASGTSFYFIYINKTKDNLISLSLGVGHTFTQEIYYITSLPVFTNIDENNYPISYIPFVKSLPPSCVLPSNNSKYVDIAIHKNIIFVIYPTYNNETKEYISVLFLFDELSTEYLGSYILYVNTLNLDTLFTTIFIHQNKLVFTKDNGNINNYLYYAIPIESLVTNLNKTTQSIEIFSIKYIPSPVSIYNQSMDHYKNLSLDFIFSLQLHISGAVYKHTFPPIVFYCNNCYFFNISNLYNYIKTLSTATTVSIKNISNFTITSLVLNSTESNINYTNTVSFNTILPNNIVSCNILPMPNSTLSIDITLSHI